MSCQRKNTSNCASYTIYTTEIQTLFSTDSCIVRLATKNNLQVKINYIRLYDCPLTWLTLAYSYEQATNIQGMAAKLSIHTFRFGFYPFSDRLRF